MQLIIDCLKKEKEDIVASFKEEKESLHNKIREKENELKEKEADIRDILKSSHTNNNINVNNTYKMDLKIYFEKLPLFTDSLIKERINQIDGKRMIYLNEHNVQLNFAIAFVEAIKDLTFCTDSSRGSLIIKNELGEEQKITSEEFVIQCFSKSTKECVQILKTAEKYCISEYENGNILEEYYHSIRGNIILLNNHIKQKGNNDEIKNISALLVKRCDKVARKNATNPSLLASTN